MVLNSVKAVLGHRFRVWRIAVPVWLIMLIAVVGAVAGQAVGPVLAGSITWSTGVVVEQAVVLDVSDGIDISGADDSTTTVNDEGTGFTIAIETDVGQSQTVDFDLENDSGKSANMLLTLNIPAGLDVQIQSEDDMTEAQLNRNQWIFNVDSGDSDFDLIIESKDDIKPGFYTITGSLVQVD